MSMENGNGELEKKLWSMANKLRGPVPSAEYRDIVLGLLFLKYMSEAYEKRRKELRRLTQDRSNTEYYVEDVEERQLIIEDKDEYTSKGIFYVPPQARWQHLVEAATQPGIGKKIDDAMRALEAENPRLKGMLTKKYERSKIPRDSVESLLEEFADINVVQEGGKDFDVFGRIYEYFIKEFAKHEGEKGGEFYTPKSIVELMVECLEPYKGRIYDPFCGSGGIFVQSQKFLQRHNEKTSQISIYGQEIKIDTLKLCKMNLYLRGMDGNIQLGDTLRDDKHKDLKADYIITNPPFNVSDWGDQAISDDDPRFKYGRPSGNANYATMQHMLHHTTDTGMVATVMANGAMSVQREEGSIRERMIQDDLLDAVIALPKQLFYTTKIPACIFIFAKNKAGDQYRDREGETLFIDARDMYKSVDRTQNILSEDHISEIAETMRAYRGENGLDYEDQTGFCKVATTEEIADNRFIVTPGRYVGIEEKEKDDEPFEQKMERLSADLREKFQQSAELQNRIEKDLEEIGF